jgi:hypothetical protein
VTSPANQVETMSRSAFVKSMPVDIPVQDVIERGQKQGLDIKAADVHAARYYMRKEQEKKPAERRIIRPSPTEPQQLTFVPGGKKDVPGKKERALKAVAVKAVAVKQEPPAPVPAPVPAPAPKPVQVAPPPPEEAPRERAVQAASSAEAQFCHLTRRIGTTRARQLVDEIERQLIEL